MREQRGDDTTETGAGSSPRERTPHSYYYDDGTGYEVYEPEKEEPEPEEGGRKDDDGEAKE